MPVHIIQQGKSSSCVNPVLLHHSFFNGVLKDVASLEYVIYDVSTLENLGDPQQIFPVAGRQAVDLTDCSIGGDRLSQGRYVAQHTVDANANPGDYLIKWFQKRELTDTEQEFSEPFIVIPSDEPVLKASYCSISELREMGYDECTVSSLALAKAAMRATAVINKITKRTFGAVYKTLSLDGTGSDGLLFNEAIVAVETVTANNTVEYDPDTLVVYNRHISENLLSPDDRNAPEISFRRGEYYQYYTNTSLDYYCPRRFPVGAQNIKVKGVFGYTEANGSSAGGVPSDIRKVCAMLVRRELPLIGTGQRQFINQEFRITLERTRHQTVEYASPTGVAQTMVFGLLTGDPEIDSILVAYMRPMGIGVA